MKDSLDGEIRAYERILGGTIAEVSSGDQF